MSFTKDKAGLIKTVGGISLFDGIRSNATATPDMDGLMSAADKEKLDGLHNYVHPDSGVIPGKYLVVEVDERGHVIAGQGMKYSTLADFGIADAYINLEDNSVVLGSHRVKVITPDDKVRWDQLVDVPNSRVNEWQTDITYHVNDLVIHDNMVYRCEVEHVSTTFEDDIANWVGVGAKPYIPDWQPDVQYKENEIVAYDSAVYRAVQKHTSAETFVGDIDKWQRLTGGIDSWATGKYYPVGTVLVNGDKLYQCLTAHTSTVFSDDIANWKILGGNTSSIILPEWTAGEKYKAGQLIKSQYLLYEALDDHIAGDNFDNDKDAHWQVLGGGSGGSSVVVNKTAVTAWQTNTAYTAGQLVTFNEALYRAKADHTSGVFSDDRTDKWDMLTNGIFEWATGKNYFKGMFVVADGSIYQCLVDNQSATPPADDSEHWQSVGSKIAEYVRDVTKTNDTLTITKGDGSQTTIKLESGGVIGGAKIIVNVAAGSIVTCTDENGKVVGVETAVDSTQVSFNVTYGTYTLSTPNGSSGSECTEIINVTEMKIYNVTLANSGDIPDDNRHKLYVLCEPNTTITVINGDSVQTKTIAQDEDFAVFTIINTAESINLSATKNGVTIYKDVVFEVGETDKQIRVVFAKLAVSGASGQTITISMDEYSYTKVLESDTDVFTQYIPKLGIWSVVATAASGTPISKSVEISQYKTYTVACNSKVYAFFINSAISDPEKKITYLEDCAKFTPAKMNYNTGKFDWGSWNKEDFFIPRPCMLKSDGTVDYYLNEKFYNLRADSNKKSDISNPDYDGNAMMEWGRYGKKIWYKIVPDKSDATSATVYISDNQMDKDYHAWSFINAEGKMVDHFYTPIYNGTVIKNKLRSLSGFEITRNNNVDKETTYAEANNPDGKKMWYTEVYADVLLINLLLMLLGKSTDTQTVFGYGNTSGEVRVTGQLNSYGLFYGFAENNFTGVKVFGMEDWWGGYGRRYAGHVTDASKYQRVKLTYGREDGSSIVGYAKANTSFSSYINTGISDMTSGFISAEQFHNSWGMVPCKANQGSATTHYCDYNYGYGANYYAIRGVQFVSQGVLYNPYAGAFYMCLNWGETTTHSGIAAALSCKPYENKASI